MSMSINIVIENKIDNLVSIYCETCCQLVADLTLLGSYGETGVMDFGLNRS